MGEGDGEVEVCLQLNVPLVEDLEITVSAASGSGKTFVFSVLKFSIVFSKATGDVDYINGERTVSFPTGATEACVAFDIIDDILQENDEIFTVTFSLRPGIMTGVHATATVTIIDNDGG